jgi:hypothetical protein
LLIGKSREELDESISVLSNTSKRACAAEEGTTVILSVIFIVIIKY